MSRRIYGSGPWRRLLSTLLVVAFTLSFSGIGFAAEATGPEAPAAPVEASTPVESAPAEPAASEPAPAPAEEAAPGESEVVPPVTAEPAPETTLRGAPAPAARSGGTRASGPTTGRSTTTEQQTVAGQSARKIAAAAVTAAAVQSAGSVGVALDGYRLTPSPGWMGANLGKDYQEGDWVPYRFIIDNSGGDDPVSFGAFSFVYDHYLNSGGKNAVGFDATTDWKYYTTAVQPATGDPVSHSGTAISPAAQDVATFGSSQFMTTSFSAGAIVVPAHSYAVVMYKTHLAVTPWWLQQSPSRNGSGFYPGSSLQMRVDSPSGDKTVTLPVPPEPDAAIQGVKYNDLDHDGTRDAGEPGLEGWVFNLHGDFGQFSFTQTVTSTAGGAFAFSALPAGSYSLNEVLKADWTNSTPLPMVFSLASGQIKPIEVGNYRDDVTKSFSLSIDNAPAGATFYVMYTVNGGAAQKLDLTGSGPYTASVDVPYGAVITTDWYADYAGEDLLLDSTGPETLTSDFTNTLSYASSVSGTKFENLDGDGVRDAGEDGLPNWAISLYRVGVGDPALYASTLTGSDGSYSFTDVLPGMYYVEETQQTGYFMTVGPTGDFAVSHGSTIDGLDFGNTPARASLDVVKTGVSLAHEGDEITYHIVVTNNGNATLYNVLVDDPLFGAPLGTIAVLGVGESVQFDPTYVVPAGVDPVDNTVEALGEDEFGSPAYDSATWTVDIIHPAISVAKTVDFDGDGVYGEDETGYSGDTAAWRIIVTNTGDVALTDVMVTDDHGADYGPISLGVGESEQFDYAGPLTVDRLNTAEATGIDPLELEVSDTDTAQADVIAPALEVVKSVEYDGDGVFTDSETNFEGETATWHIYVHNTGDVTLYDIEITDTNGQVFNVAELAPGASSEVFEYSTIPVDDLVNVAVATAIDELENEVGPVEDAAEVIVEPFLPFGEPDVAIDKTADKTTAKPGELVHYTLTYTNVSTNTAQGITITDDYDERYVTIVSAPGGTVSGGKIVWTDDEALFAGESRSVSYTARVDADMPVGTTNVDNVVVIVVEDDYNPFNDRDDWRVRVSESEPFLPFTGSEFALVLLLAAALVLVGASLRRLARHEA